jgi:hypothetical protein
MGIDLTRLANHAMYYTDAVEMVQKIEAKTGYPVWVSLAENGSWPEPPPTFKGWRHYVDEGKTLQQQLNEHDLITFVRTNEKGEEEDFELSPYLIDFYSEDFYFGRWFQVQHFADEIREHGLPSPGNYHLHPAEWQLQQRKNYFDYCMKLGSTASVIFCDDLHQEWLEYCYEDLWTLDQFVEWGKKEFIFVRFADLVSFDFPKSKPDYYNVFIYDDFQDLLSTG